MRPKNKAGKDETKKEFAKELDNYTSIGMLSKEKQGYIYPKWLLPYCGHKDLMQGISSIKDKSYEQGRKDALKQVEKIIDDEIGFHKGEMEAMEEENDKDIHYLEDGAIIQELEELKSRIKEMIK